MRRTALFASLLLAVGCATQPLPRQAGAGDISAARPDHERQIVVTIRDTKSALRSPPGSTARVYGSAPAYRGSPYAQRVMASLARDYPLDWITDWYIDLLDVHCVVFRSRGGENRNALIARLTQDRRVESVQPMHTFRTHVGAGEYNDPYFPLQRSVEAMRVPQAHQWSRGRGVSVAVIDTGVDLSHPELAGRIRLARNFVDSDGERFRADRHGTAVAGVIASLTDNGAGIIGVAPASKILALKACWQELADGSAVCSTLTLAEAISFAVSQRAHVINLSLGGPSDALLTRLLREAMKRGIVVIGARAPGVSAMQGFPLNVAGIIAVTDADEPGAAQSRPIPDAAEVAPLAAPGREVLTLVPGGRYDYVSGASISAALVSGVVALLLEQRAGLSAQAVRALLESTARPPGHRPYRLVNACDAVAALVRAPACATQAGARRVASTSVRLRRPAGP